VKWRILGALFTGALTTFLSILLFMAVWDSRGSFPGILFGILFVLSSVVSFFSGKDDD
jgi:hypothetical protein